ncbi:MAG: cyclase family protein [Anaerolineae bacterium]|nr:MAG: cyclase family protein [Anaerolineae bacterium]
MRTYDISLTISPDLPVWPGDPRVNLQRVSTIASGADANVTHIAMSAHTGTHVDAPYHFLDDGSPVHELDLRMLMGRVFVLHLPDVDVITADILRNAEIPPRTRRLLFRTRNSELWGTPHSAEFQENYVALSADAAEYLVARGVKVVGVDYLSVAPFHDTVPTHKILLRNGVIVIEGLNLSAVSEGRYTLYCLPLKLQGADGAPARAVLVGV